MSTEKRRILDDDRLVALAREHGTPLYVYDAGVVKQRIEELRGFDVIRYAQKANSNLALLALMRRFGALVDAVSAGEIARALAAGYANHEIVFTADLFDRAALSMLAEHPVPVNLGSPGMLAQYAAIGRGREITLRVNPGFGHGHDRKVSTGGEASKHGVWHEELPSVVTEARRLGLAITGLHVHIGSGSDIENLTRVCSTLGRLVTIVKDSLKMVSAGGGLPVPYRASDARLDIARFTRTWREARSTMEKDIGRKLNLEVEPGRYLVAEAGALLTEVRGVKRSGNVDYVLVDAGFHNLVRPAMYGAFHQISVVGREADEPRTPKVVAGPLCESADVFTQDRAGHLAPQMLPAVHEGDIVCIHDAGAYGASMASGYNSQPIAAEVLVEEDEARLVRRRQTIEEMLRNETAE